MDHNILITKLAENKIKGRLRRWIRELLRERNSGRVRCEIRSAPRNSVHNNDALRMTPGLILKLGQFRQILTIYTSGPKKT